MSEDITIIDTDELADKLHDRIQREIERMLLDQLKDLGEDKPTVIVKPDAEFYDFTISGVKRILYPDDPMTLATYEYKGKQILGVRISDTGMAIEFDIPKLNPIEEEQHE